MKKTITDADRETVAQAIAGDVTVSKYGLKVINYGNCMLCGEKLTDSLFFCKECEEKNRKREMKIENDDFETLAICAIRYCQGRQTYMPDSVRGIIRPCLSELSDNCLNIMIDDCEFQESVDLYGDEKIDKPGWLKWKTELIAEIERRQNDKL